MFYDFADDSTDISVSSSLSMGEDPVIEIVDAYNERKLYIKRQLGKKDGLTAEDVQGKSLTKQERDPKSESSKRGILIPDLLYEEILRLRSMQYRAKTEAF